MVSDTGREEEITCFELVNDADRLTAAFTFSSKVSVWFFPLITISQSEEGFERTYQGTSLLFSCPLILDPEEKNNLQIQLQLTDLTKNSCMTT